MKNLGKYLTGKERNKEQKKYPPAIKTIAVLSGCGLAGLFFAGISYAGVIPIPNITAIYGQIQSVETSAGGAFSALQGLAGTLGYAPGASGGPLFNPGPGLSEAMATVDKLTADVSKMEEEYQGIVINYDKLVHVVNSVENAVNSINNLNSSINNAFNAIPQDITSGDANVNYAIPQATILSAETEGSEFNNFAGVSAATGFDPRLFMSGYSASVSNNLTKNFMEEGSQAFADSLIYNSSGNAGTAAPKINCRYYDNGYYLDSSGNIKGGCTDFTGGLVSDSAASGLYNAGVSAARAHKAEIEGGEFMNEIAGGALKADTNYYAYQGSVLTVIAEEDAASLKNMGYIESQLKQLEIDKSAGEISREHSGAVIAPVESNLPDISFYRRTTM